MKSFLQSVSKFLLPLVAGMFLIEIFLRILPGENSTKHDNFLAYKDSIELLILGNSHALRGVNPHDFKNNAYNMAMVSQPLQIDYEILIRNQAKMPGLKAVILSVSYFTLSKKMNEGELVNRLPFYKQFYGLEFEGSDRLDLKSYSLQLSMGSKRSIEFLKNLVLNSADGAVNCDDLGWLGEGGKKCFNRHQFRTHAKSVFKNHEDGSIDFESNIKKLKHIAEWGDSSGTYILLVNTPKTSFYNNLLDSVKNKLIDTELTRLELNHESVRYFDFSDDMSFKLDDFRNSDHLNKQGAAKFSFKLDSILTDLLDKSHVVKEYTPGVNDNSINRNFN